MTESNIITLLFTSLDCTPLSAILNTGGVYISLMCTCQLVRLFYPVRLHYLLRWSLPGFLFIWRGKSLSWPLRDIFLSPGILFWIPPLHQGCDSPCYSYQKVQVLFIHTPTVCSQQVPCLQQASVMASLCPQFPGTGILHAAPRAACWQSMQITQT